MSASRLVFVARVGRPHGIAGEVYLDRCDLDAKGLRSVGGFEWRARDGKARAITLADSRDTHDRPLVRFSGVHSRETAAPYVNGELWAEADKLPDPGPGRSYAFQLLGLTVATSDGRTLGKIRDVVDHDGRTFYDVEGMKSLLPAHEPFLKHVDFAAGIVTLDLPAGFEDL